LRFRGRKKKILPSSQSSGKAFPFGKRGRRSGDRGRRRKKNGRSFSFLLPKPSSMKRRVFCRGLKLTVMLSSDRKEGGASQGEGSGCPRASGELRKGLSCHQRKGGGSIPPGGDCAVQGQKSRPKKKKMSSFFYRKEKKT